MTESGRNGSPSARATNYAQRDVAKQTASSTQRNTIYGVGRVAIFVLGGVVSSDVFVFSTHWARSEILHLLCHQFDGDGVVLDFIFKRFRFVPTTTAGCKQRCIINTKMIIVGPLRTQLFIRLFSHLNFWIEWISFLRRFPFFGFYFWEWINVSITSLSLSCSCFSPDTIFTAIQV